MNASNSNLNKNNNDNICGADNNIDTEYHADDIDEVITAYIQSLI